MHVISHVKLQSLLDPVISKRKAADDYLDTSTLPFEKKQRVSAARLKRKASEATSCGSRFKTRALCRTYAIADITAHLAAADNQSSTNRVLLHGAFSPAASFSGQVIFPLIISHWPFPNELVLMIFAYLPVVDLQSIVQVSRLSRDLAAPLYFLSVGLSIEQTWLLVNAQTCLALPLYSRTTSFCAPRFLRCDLLGAGDRDVRALKIFLESLIGVQNTPISSVICFDAPPGVDLASLFQLIKNLGCSSFSYSSSDSEQPCTIIPTPVPGSDLGAVCSLRRLSVDSPMFFSPCVASLTLATLRDCPLIDLSLTHTGLNSIQWAALLRNVHLPLLRTLTVDVECPPCVLANFLICHQNIGQLWIHPGQTLVQLKSQNHSSQKLRGYTSQQIPNSHLHKLDTLGGPSWYLVPLLAIIRPAPCIRNLNLRFEEDLTSNHFLGVLDVTRYFTSIQALRLSFLDASHNANHYDVPYHEHRTVPAKQLTISVRGSDPDDLLFRCHPWLSAFHELESVELQAKHTSPSEMLAVLFSCPDNPFQLKISSSDF
ncbi:hypothetical protein C8R48DRAFT_775036 [Suillus tomentosus]|nr:hypothetical protein C8R48DRAFT_775036 [Suillus tomentosus]